MAQLKTLDTAYLKAQDPHQHASLAIAAVAIVDGAVPDFDLLKILLAERIQSIPRCTQLLRTHPADTAREWIDYPGFNLTQHLHRVAIPRPGDDAGLFRAVAHALERPLELDRPLWECWVIEGLKGNRWAILMKIHHCLAEGTSAAQILTRLCDDANTDTFATPTGAKQVSPPARKPSWADTLWRLSEVAGALSGAGLARGVDPVNRPGRHQAALQHRARAD